jgi:tetratricopeptide (TPR) repeat protein
MKQQKKYKLADILWERDVWNAYYDGMEALSEDRLADAEKIFEKALRLNPDFPGSYEGLAYVARKKHDKEMEAKHIQIAFEKAKAMYVPHWPKRLPWSDIENRPILRIMLMLGMLYHENGDRRVAGAIYVMILKLNPSDNQGVRYLIAGMKKGLTPDEIDAA